MHQYIDDYLSIGEKGVAEGQFARVCQLLEELGLPMNANKRKAPCKAMTVLGITIDNNRGTLSIDGDKLEEIRDHVINTQGKKFLSMRSLQSLLDKLLYINKCIKSSRGFMNHMLQTLRDNHWKRMARLSNSFHRDLNWFASFLRIFNGISYFNQDAPPEIDIYLDACLLGLGGVLRVS